MSSLRSSRAADMSASLEKEVLGALYGPLLGVVRGSERELALGPQKRLLTSGAGAIAPSSSGASGQGGGSSQAALPRGGM